MKKNIYEILNGAEMDLTEYDVQDLSVEEKEIRKQHILKEINKTDLNKKHRRISRIIKTVAGFAAAFALTFGLIGFVNPSLAKDIYNAVFSGLIDNANETPISMDDELYATIAKYAVPIEEELKKRPDDSNYTTTSECNGVTLSVSDVYCDGYILYYTLKLETDNELLKDAKELFPHSITDNSVALISTEEIDVFEYNSGGYSLSPFKKAKDGSYVLMNQIELMEGIPEEHDTITINFNMPGLNEYAFGSLENIENSGTSANVDGEWNIRFPVTIDRACNEIIEVNKKDKGITLKNLVKTRIAIIAEVVIDDSNNEYYDSEQVIYAHIPDDNGYSFPPIFEAKEDSAVDTVQYCMCIYDGQKEINISVDILGNDSENSPHITDFRVKIP